MAELFVRVLAGSSSTSKNVHVQVSGYLDGDMIDWRSLVKAGDFSTKSLRLDAVTYALSDKIELLLAWDKNVEGEDPHVFLPLNGRGRLDFDSINGLQNTVGEGKSGDILIHVSHTGKTERSCYFTLALDFSKQGN